MRQKLPDEAGYELVSAEAGVIWPGREFGAPALVPGCVSLEPPDEAGAEAARDGAGPAQGSPAGTPAGEGDPPPGPEAPGGAQDDAAPDDSGRAPGRKTTRAPKEPQQ